MGITFNICCPVCGSDQITRPTNFDFNTNFTGVSCGMCGRPITKADAIKQLASIRPRHKAGKRHKRR
ncbi:MULTISPECIES: ECs_2282 family putative zinc-binding protein [Musicola]|uniref:ECs_2282 family putative zinc-binding protein n=1 Tax=Musicola TaxID=2884243 RepID=UPI003B8A838C